MAMSPAIASSGFAENYGRSRDGRLRRILNLDNQNRCNPERLCCGSKTREKQYSNRVDESLAHGRKSPLLHQLDLASKRGRARHLRTGPRVDVESDSGHTSGLRIIAVQRDCGG
jgi:hypothetical protein